MMVYQFVLFEKKNNLAYVTMNRPQVLNAINLQMRQELIDVFSKIKSDAEVNAILINGAGERAFSVGADIKEPSDQEENGEDRRITEWELDKPVIAAIHGYCLGLSLQIVLSCDIRIASEDAQFGLPEISLGRMVFGGGTQKLPRLVGTGKALEMILSGERINAQEALIFNLVNKVVPRQELLPASEKLAKTIASKDPISVRFSREAVYRGHDMPLEEALRLERDLAYKVNTRFGLKGQVGH